MFRFLKEKSPNHVLSVLGWSYFISPSFCRFWRMKRSANSMIRSQIFSLSSTQLNLTLVLRIGYYNCCRPLQYNLAYACAYDCGSTSYLYSNALKKGRRHDGMLMFPWVAAILQSFRNCEFLIRSLGQRKYSP